MRVTTDETSSFSRAVRLLDNHKQCIKLKIQITDKAVLHQPTHEQFQDKSHQQNRRKHPIKSFYRVFWRSYYN